MVSDKTSRATGILLINLGAPETIAGIRPFLTNLFSDPAILPIKPAFLRKFIASRIAGARAGKVAPKYRAIGGGSPLLRITKQQVAALQSALAERGGRAVVIAGMRYSSPTLSEALSDPAIKNFDRLVLLPLYPQYSVATTGSALDEIERIRRKSPHFPPTITIKSWHDHPAYLDAMASRLKSEMSKFSPKARENLHVVFSAHSIPEKLALRGDPYPDQVRRTVAGLLERTQVKKHHLAWQSRVGPVRWLRPSTTETLDMLPGLGATGVLVVPVSFVSDHLETLHEIDIEMREKVESTGGVEFRRMPSPNADPDFIGALAGLVAERLADANGEKSPET